MFEMLGWPKSAFEVFHKMLQKNPNEPFGQPNQFSSVHLLSHVQLFATPWTAARQASLSITNSRSLLRLMSFGSVLPSNHLIRCCPLLLLPSMFPSLGVFSNESALRIRWPKYWSFNFNISPSWFPLGWTGWISLQSKELETMKIKVLEIFIDLPSISCWMVMDVCETLWDNKHRGTVNQIISRATQSGEFPLYRIKRFGHLRASVGYQKLGSKYTWVKIKHVQRHLESKEVTYHFW